MSGRTIVFIALSLAPAALAFAVLILVARVRRSSFWIIPGWIAAAALAPVIATFFGVRLVISALQGMAMSGGGVAVICAGLWEAVQPLVFASYLACGLLLVTVVIAIRAVIDEDDEEEPARTASMKATAIAVVVLLLAVTAGALAPFLLRDVGQDITDVLDPRVTPTQGPAEMSQYLSSRLVKTAATAVALTIALFASIVVVSVMRPQQRPSAMFVRMLVFIAVLALVGAIANAIVYRTWAAALDRTAVTGQL